MRYHSNTGVSPSVQHVAVRFGSWRVFFLPRPQSNADERKGDLEEATYCCVDLASDFQGEAESSRAKKTASAAATMQSRSSPSTITKSKSRDLPLSFYEKTQTSTGIRTGGRSNADENTGSPSLREVVREALSPHVKFHLDERWGGPRCPEVHLSPDGGPSTYQEEQKMIRFLDDVVSYNKKKSREKAVSLG